MEDNTQANISSETPPSSSPVKEQVQDIFSDTDSLDMSSTAQVSTTPRVSEIPYNPYSASTGGSMSKKTMILVIGALVALVGIVGAAILIYMLIKNTGQPTAVSTPSTTVTQPETPKTTETTSPSTTEQPAVNPTPTPQPSSETTTTPPADRDNDGLSDEEEATLGINPDLPDTDNDGLTDREEVKVYKTDPRNADTDGDGYLDGQEVKGGYNPNGPGKMNVTQ